MKKILLLIAIVSIALFGYFSFEPEKSQSQRPRAIPNVVVAKVEVMPIRDEVEALGTGRAYESIIVTSKVSEIVSEINFDDGDIVEKGAVLVRLRNDEHKAKVAVAEVKLAENLRELERIRSLISSKTIAELERDRLQSLIDTTRAEVEQAKAALNDRVISAPFAGRLGLRQVSVGSLVTPGEQISTLDDVSKIKLDFSVPERFIQELIPGKLVEAHAVAYPDRVFKGVVTSIDSRVNPETRAVVVRAVMANADLSLLPGMLMKVKLIKQSREALLLPEAAIIPIQDKHYVYLVDQDNKVVQQQVTLGIRSRGWAEITDGLSVGQQVMIRGILKVRPGDEVKVQQAENFKFAQVEEMEKSA
ncbi:efflux RND transporter periplasmic adaptor subunit [Shewanella inventionis]|uniref:efflux RND transporter periplasmic adaptor subunit n=1 Tax=Shewanella inventionis TaxID=1738770 RepID=UPI001CBAEBE2|nr:efflux RND transporter periplasmic adaptor subunit [Shewanella inventionis]UAL41596.1 efflux RND transporter periplasmic adaptor subunit [Shewanella inventionis]